MKLPVNKGRWIELNLKWQTDMQKQPVDRKYLEDAFDKMVAGEADTEKYPLYPTGAPTLRGLYDLAITLMAAESTAH